MDWNSAQTLLRVALTQRQSSPSHAIFKSILISGKPRTGKHALIKSVLRELNNTHGKVFQLLHQDGGDDDSSQGIMSLSTILSNASRRQSDKACRFPFSSSFFHHCQNNNNNKNKNQKTAMPSTKVVLWEDLHLAIGGFTSYTTDSDFAADVVESICKCLKVDYPQDGNFVVVALFDDETMGGGGFAEFMNDNSTSNSNNKNAISAASSSSSYSNIRQVLRRCFDLVIDLVSPTPTKSVPGADSLSAVKSPPSSSCWDTIVGHAGAKQLLQESITEPLKPENVKLLRSFGIAPMTLGILLTGVPGTGKTLLARALAKSIASHDTTTTMATGEDSSPSSFFSLDASSIVSAEVGVSEKRLVELFESARRRAPSVIFIDEAQAIFRKGCDDQDEDEDDADEEEEYSRRLPRTNMNRNNNTTPSDKRLTTTLLRLMDENRKILSSYNNKYFDDDEEQENDPSSQPPPPPPVVIVVAATNIPSMIEPALLRFGRLSQVVHVPPPTLPEVKSMARRWLQSRHNILIPTENNNHNHDDEVGESVAVTNNTTPCVWEWLLNEAIVEWASSSSKEMRKKQQQQKKITKNVPTGADVAGLLNLIDLRLVSFIHDANNSPSPCSTPRHFLMASPITKQHKELILAVLERVKPSVTPEALKEVAEFKI